MVLLLRRKPNSKEITDSLKVASNFSMESTTQDQSSKTTKHAVKLLPSFSLPCDIGEVFTKCFTGSSGGYKEDRAAQQIVTRCFLDFVVKTRKSWLLTWWTLGCVLQICCSGLSKCNLQYVGSTTTEFKVRFRNHKSFMKTSKKTCEVAIHFNRAPHVLSDFTFQCIDQIQNSTFEDTEKLLITKEAYWSAQLFSLAPFGLNKRQEFRSKNRIHYTWF